MAERNVGRLNIGNNTKPIVDELNVGDNGVIRIYQNGTEPVVKPNTGAIYTDGDELFFKNGDGTVIALGSGGGGPAPDPKDYDVDFAFNSIDPFILKNYDSGEVIKEIVIAVLTPFDIGAEISIGFPGQEELFVPRNQIDITVASLYKYHVYTKLSSADSLRVFDYGSYTQGLIRIFVKDG